MKDCTECCGWGYHQEDLDAIKETCETCKGSGKVELSEDEILQEQAHQGQDELHRLNAKLTRRI